MLVYVRPSNEALLRVRVLRARRAPGRFLLILLMPRVARAKETNGLPVPSYTGRGARTVGWSTAGSANLN